MSEVKSKVCICCGQDKPLSAFYLKRRDDYSHECIDCRIASANGEPGQPTMAAIKISSDQAMLELTLLNAESEGQAFEDVVIKGINCGIPTEILTRMKELWERTKLIGEEVIAVGKIIVMKIIEFLKAHPKLTISLAIGAAAYLVSHAIPVVGPIIAPLVAATATAATLAMTISFDEAVGMAKDFFQLIIDVFNQLANRWAST